MIQNPKACFPNPPRPHNLLDRRLNVDGRQVRFTSYLDEETLRFETELCHHIDLALAQRHVLLAVSRREFRLLQIRDAAGRAAMQVAVYIHRPARLKGHARGLTPKFGRAISLQEEAWGLRMLRRLCTECRDLMTLRLQPLRYCCEELAEFEGMARSCGYSSSDPIEYTRTLKYDLSPAIDDLLAQMSKKTRAKVRHRTREEVEIRVLTEAKYIPQCRAALSASFERTGGDTNQFDFEAAFDVARNHPDQAIILGFFLPGQLDTLKAYVIAYRGGDLAEYVSAGSLADPALRKMPFNYFLVWELIQWAHGHGAKWLDLGGITPGGDRDSRATISEFKRHLSETEIEIGREMLATLQPVRTMIFERLNGLRLVRRENTLRTFAGISLAVWLAIFLSFSLKFFGNPESPAWERLRKNAHMPQIAVIGDSRAHAGISPTSLATAMKEQGLPELSAYNFAVDGTDVLHHYSFLTHALLEGWAVPRVIIWTPNPLGFNSLRQSNRLEQLPPSDIRALYRAGAPLEMLLDLATMAVFPPYRDRPLALRTLFDDYGGRAAIRTLPLQTRLLGLDYQPELKSRAYHTLGDGQEPFTVLHWEDRFRRGADAYLKDYESLKLSELHFNMARELMRRAKKAGSLLIVLELPVAPFYQERLTSNPKHQEWRVRLREIAAQEGAVFWSHADHFSDRLHDDHRFGDPGHMPEATAAEYSRFLGEELAADSLVRAALDRKDRI